MTATLVILGLAAVFFVSGRIRSDLVAVMAALSLILTGVLTPEEALAGFSNPVVIMMLGLFVVGGGIFSTGLAKKAGGKIIGLAGDSELKLFILLMVATGAIGAFVSNTGTIALMMPIVVGMAKAAGLPPSRFLLPLAFAGSMGGMLTLIGTPPNLIVSDALVAAGYEPLHFFSFTPIGVVCFVVGIAALVPLTRWALPAKDKGAEKGKRHKSLEQMAAEYRLGDKLSALRVEKNSPAIGRSVRELDVYSRFGLTVVEIRRVNKKRGALLKSVKQYAAAGRSLEEGDIMLLLGAADKAAELAAEHGLGRITGADGMKFYDIGLAEMLVMPTSSLEGKTVTEAAIRKNFGVSVLGIRRKGEYILDSVANAKLRTSDVLLIQGEWKNIGRLAGSNADWVVLGEPVEQAKKVAMDYKAPVAAAIMVAMAMAMAFDFIPVAPVTAVMAAAVLMILSGCIRNVEEAYKTINWQTITLFGAMLPMSTALEKTGLSTLISHSLVDHFGGGNPYVLLAAVYLATSVMTLFISNTVTAVLMTPIAIAAAADQGASAVPFAIAVSVAATMCFASPFSTPPNALVMSAGGYKPMDYIKVGVPLQAIMAVVMIAVLPLLFPF